MPRLSFKVLSYLFLIAVMIEFFLAGLGMAELGGESMRAHRVWGYAVLHIIPVLMFGAAIWAKMPRTTIIMTGVLFILIVAQPFLAREEVDAAWLRAFHVLNALFIFMLGYHLSQRAGPMRLREGT